MGQEGCTHYPTSEGKKGYRQLKQQAKDSRRNLRIVSWPDGIRGAVFLPKKNKRDRNGNVSGNLSWPVSYYFRTN